MTLVSPFLKNALYPFLSTAGVFRRTSRSGLAIVTYHGVLPAGYETVDPALDGNLISRETLRRQLRLLKSSYNVISPEDILAWREGKSKLPARAVLLTCDDGLLNVLTDMLPVVREEGLRCLFFVTGTSAGADRTMLWYQELLFLFLRSPDGRFEITRDGVVLRGELAAPKQRRALWWDSVMHLSQVPGEVRSSLLAEARARFGLESRRCLDERQPGSLRRFGLLTGAELRELSAAGMTIGAHTTSHPMLSKMPIEQVRAEIAENRTRLEAVLQQRVWAFAYPFGNAESVTPQVLAIPQECGYQAGFLNFGGGLGADLPPYALPRIHVSSEMSLSELEAHVSGFHGQLQRLWRRSPQVAFR